MEYGFFCHIIVLLIAGKERTITGKNRWLSAFSDVTACTKQNIDYLWITYSCIRDIKHNTSMSLHELGISVDVHIRQLSVKKKLLNYIYTPHNEVVSGYTGGFTMSVSCLLVKRGGSLSFLMIFTFAVPELLDLIWWKIGFLPDHSMSYDNLSSVSQNVLKFWQQLTGEERRVPFIFGRNNQ